MPSALLNVVGSQIPLLLVALLYGPDDAGNLAQAIMLGALPAALIGSAISTVFLAELATRVRDGEPYQRRRYLKLSRTLLPLGLVWFLLLTLVIPRLLPIVLGPGWLLSGSFSLALASSVATGLVVSPLTIVLLIYQRTVLTPVVDLLRVVVVTGVGLGAWAAGFNSVMAVLLMSIGLTCIYVITWFLGLRIVSSRTHESPQN
jgi:O-antigen/teichoic acid export membrane protein